MVEHLLKIDRELLIFLNNFGSEQFDFLWLLITKQANWTPFFLLLAFLIYKKIGLKNLGMVILFIAILLTVGNESVEFCKSTVQRLRPCNDIEINTLIRILKPSKSFSFFSGHATNSMSTMMFVFLILKKYYKYSFLIFLYPLIFAYSRIYLGVHFPSDILTGYLYGMILGFLFYKMYVKIHEKYFSAFKYNDTISNH
jgi:undecaprenyl-diphosphatase